MTIFLTIVHILVCLFLVIVVLLQSGKAADLAGAFGGMGSQTAFGPRGAGTFLSKATTVAAGLFMVTSLSLAILATRNAGGTSSVLQRSGVSQTAPAQKSGSPATGTPAGSGQTAAPAATSATPNVVPTPIPAPPPGTPQPSIDLVDPSGKVVKSMPLDVNKLPRVDPKNPKLPTVSREAILGDDPKTKPQDKK